MGNSMDKRRAYNLSRALTVTSILGTVGIAIIFKQQLLVAFVILANGFWILWMLRARYKALVLVDERTARIEEKAASAAYALFLVAGWTVILVEYVLEAVGIRIQPFETAVEPLSYALLGLMLAFGIVHSYYSRKM
jgi:uncharacterized membrane protein